MRRLLAISFFFAANDSTHDGTRKAPLEIDGVLAAGRDPGRNAVEFDAHKSVIRRHSHAPLELVEFAPIKARGVGGLIVAAAKNVGGRILRLLMIKQAKGAKARKHILAPLAFRRYNGCYIFNCQARCSV